MGVITYFLLCGTAASYIRPSLSNMYGKQDTPHSTATRSNRRWRRSSRGTTSSSLVRSFLLSLPLPFSLSPSPHLPTPPHLTYTQLTNPPLRPTEEYWSNVSETAQDFVRTCLTIDPAARPTAEEALRHRWLASDEPHGVQDAEGQMRNLLPQIQKAFDAKRTCECLACFVSLAEWRPVLTNSLSLSSPEGGVRHDGDAPDVDDGGALAQRACARRGGAAVQGGVGEGKSYTCMTLASLNIY